MNSDLDHIISLCKKRNRRAQQDLYEMYSPVLFSIALRYMKEYHYAEDVLVTGFAKIFDKIDSFQGNGSFEGWMKRIVVNEALMQLRKKNNLHMAVEISDVDVPMEAGVISQLQYEELLSIIDELPVGYRTVFNLYIIEGYKHREIAEMLGISINTSKSQLILAKKKLRTLIKKKIVHSHEA